MGLSQNLLRSAGADPYVYRHTDGYYYYTCTTSRCIKLAKSETLLGIKDVPSVTIWTAPESGPNSRDIWAPEIHFLDNKWYIYYAACDGQYFNRRMFVMENSSPDPLQGTWKEKGRIHDPADKWAIDGTVFEHGGKRYFVWSGWEGDTRIRQNIYIAEMSSPWTISGNRVELTRPEFDWELERAQETHPYVNEGPAVLKRNGRIFLAYSASVFATDGYCLGMLTANENTDLLDQKSWVKSREPVFKKSVENSVYGPGHNSFTQSPDGKEDWIVYHAYDNSISTGIKDRKRSARAQKFTWKEDGTPDFGIPVSISDNMNVVWLLVDHIAFRQYRDFFKKKYPLKNFERLSSEGMTFDRAYSVCPLCCPARASMVTGLYPHNNGITQNNKEHTVRGDIEPGTKILSDYVKEQRYRAGYFGKWHVGYARKSALDYGFEGFSQNSYGNPYSSEEYKEYIEKHNLPVPIVHMEWCVGGGEPGDFNMLEINRFAGESDNGYRGGSAGVFKGPAELHEAYFVSDLASQWLKDRAEDKQPFVLRVDVWGPHQPYNVGTQFAGMIDPSEIEEFPNFKHDYEGCSDYKKRFRERCRAKTGLETWEDWQPVVARCYENMIQVDAALGKVLDMLDSTGLAENTIVMLTADHGDALAVSGGLFDKGAMMIEETMSIPMVVRWPGVTKPGTRSDALVTNMDFVPTVLEMCGSTPPEDFDGRSLVPLLKNPAEKWPEELMCEHHGHGGPAFQRLMYYKNYKYLAHLNDKHELYDLEKDPCEMFNIIDDPSLSGVLRDIRSRLGKIMDNTRDYSTDAMTLRKEMNI